MKRTAPVLFSILLLLFAVPAEGARTARGKKAMVATANPLASEAAVRVLKDGGNAADAFVAAALVLGVVEPYSAGLGGGGFLLYRDRDGKVSAFDFRERAPARATRDLYVRDGKVDPTLSKDGALAVAIPGQPAGLEAVHAAFGKLPRKKLATEAIAYALLGFQVYPYLHEKIESTKERLARFPETAALWLPGGMAPETGTRLRQPGLARALERFASEGAAPFYTGPIAKDLVAETRRLGGILSEADLENYEVRRVEPLRGNFGEWELYSFPPPSSGGAILLEMLNLLSTQDTAALRVTKPGKLKKGMLRPASESLPESEGRAFLRNTPRWQYEGVAKHAHLLAEIMRRAYADRSEYLGDPLFTKLPLEGLLSPAYAKERMKSYDSMKAVDVDAGKPGEIKESEHTTHISIVGPDGDAVSATLTINLSFGSGITVPGWGIILNNEMDDFAAAPGVPNAFGLIQGEANAIAPGKTPLSSMTPTIALHNGRLRYVLGSPGGSRIISTVMELFVNVAVFGLTPEQAMDFPRIHHQWRPDTLYVEDAFLPAVLEDLKARGHEVVNTPTWCNGQSVWIEDDGSLLGISDERVAGEPRGF